MSPLIKALKIFYRYPYATIPHRYLSADTAENYGNVSQDCGQLGLNLNQLPPKYVELEVCMVGRICIARFWIMLPYSLADAY
jgi:hypothetical protein